MSATLAVARTCNTLALARELISRRSITPDDGGCQELIVTRLKPLGFVFERISRNGVSNLWARRGIARPLLCFAGHTDVVPTGPLDIRLRLHQLRRQGGVTRIFYIGLLADRSNAMFLLILGKPRLRLL